MANLQTSKSPDRPSYQRARATLAIGRHARLSASVKVTSGGLLAIGVLVSTILLSTTVLVRTAVRESRRPRSTPPEHNRLP